VKLKTFITGAPPAILLLVIMWMVLTIFCVMIYFLPAEAKSDSAKSDMTKILLDMWKYVTTATISALATVGGQTGNKTQVSNPEVERSDQIAGIK